MQYMKAGNVEFLLVNLSDADAKSQLQRLFSRTGTSLWSLRSFEDKYNLCTRTYITDNLASSTAPLNLGWSRSGAVYWFLTSVAWTESNGKRNTFPLPSASAQQQQQQQQQ